MVRISSRWIGVLAVLIGVAGLAAPAHAQEGESTLARTLRGPRFYSAASGGSVPIDVRQSPLLHRRISVNFDRVTLKDALAEIARQAQMPLVYSKDVVPVGNRVRLRADNITVAGALSEVLLDAGVDVLVSADGRAALVKRTERSAVAIAQGTIAGRVTDAKTGDPIVGAEILVEGSRARATTGDKGYYKLQEVEAGAVTLTVRRVGYAKQSRAVVVTAGQELTVDVALAPVVTQLDELVTTVTGEQRARELGHVVGRINADSVVREAPISNIGELLRARVPGLQVTTPSGVVGGTVKLQIRSPNSLFLTTEPIVIIDGVRYTSNTFGQERTGEQTSRLNDLNPNDIENIEIVKGPSAATLYGTDASNGVIVITTKRGHPGAIRWNTYARATRNEMSRERYPNLYWGWGTVFGVPSSRTTSCTLILLALHFCTQQDSVVAIPNPLNDANTTIFGAKPAWQYGVNVSGGRQELRYYLSGDLEQATGPFQMPKDALEALRAERGVSSLPEEQENPNALDRLNLRANITASLASRADLNLSTGYVKSTTRTGTASLYSGALSNANPNSPYGYDPPGKVLSSTTIESLDRFVGSGTARWRLRDWLELRGTVGLDQASSVVYSLSRPGEGTSPSGSAADDRIRRLGVTGDIGITAAWRRGRFLFRTSTGAQYAHQTSNALNTTGFGLPPGGESPSQATTRLLSQFYSETATLGGYLEEMIGINDRVFVTGALRVDGASGFGKDYTAAAYPKASVSWIVSDEPFVPRIPGLDELRVRYAFGVSGQQATPSMVLADYGTASAFVDGSVRNRFYLYRLGNPNLKPERVREHEVGFDATGLNGHARVGLTWFARKTIDPIVNRQLSAGYGTIYTNLGLVRAHGFEASVTVQAIETDPVSLQISLNHALRRTTLVDLGGTNEAFDLNGFSFVEGYPLGARFGPTITSYADANGDGVIARTEVQVGATRYLGESTPPITQTLVPVLGLWRQRLRLSAVIERQRGYTQIDGIHDNACASNRCSEAVDLSTPLGDQAKVSARSQGFGDVVPVSFTRLRELTAAFELPVAMLRVARIRSGSLSLSARNLALWTSFDGPDPESANVAGAAGLPASGTPQGRSFVLRLDLGL